MRQAKRSRIYADFDAQCKLVCNSNGFSQMCVLQGTLISPNEIRQSRGSALPRRNSICGKQSAAEYTRISMRCKLACNCRGFLQMSVLQGTHISPNKIRQATGSALPRRNSICGKQSAAEYTQKFRHLNRNKTQKINRNSLINFLLHGLNKHLLWFRCSGKGEHLNLTTRQNPAAKPLTTNALQDFLKLHTRFRS